MRRGVGVASTAVTADDAELARLEAEARYARDRYALYRAKAYGPGETSDTRMRELARRSEQAEARLQAARRRRQS